MTNYVDPDIYLLDLARYSDSDVESTVQNSRIYLSTLHTQSRSVEITEISIESVLLFQSMNYNDSDS